MLKLITGDPEKTDGGATSSKFVLPFRYQLSKLETTEAQTLFYTQNPLTKKAEQWTERKRYFTRETSSALFEHAKRYQISAEAWEKSKDPKYPKLIEFKPDNGELVYQVKIAPPEIVLFECQNTEQDENKPADFFQTGFLIVNTYFSNDNENLTPRYEHLLHFNERFRYWRQLYNGHNKELKELSNLANDTDDINIYLKRWQNLLTIPFTNEDDGSYYKFIPQQYCDDAQKWFKDEYIEKSKNHKDTGWIAFNDNRAFVWSNAVVEGGANALEKFNPQANLHTEPEAFEHWVKLLNVDAPSTDYKSWHSDNNDELLNNVTHYEQQWAKSRSYKRWAHLGTLYGFNYHSGVMLSGKCATPPLSTTFRRHYFDVILLLLYLRMTIFRFSSEMNELTITLQSVKKKSWWEKFKSFFKGDDWEKQFLALRKEFAIFTNLYQFPLISNQQQMLEMYQIARDNLDIDDLFKEVAQEVKNTHEYFSAEKTNKLNQIMALLTSLGVVIAVLSIPDFSKYLNKLWSFLMTLF